MSRVSKAVVVAWLIAATFYFYQYVMRSAPSVMMPQLSEGYGIATAAVASLLGLFYFGYSPFSLVAGVALDRLGPRKAIPIGAAMVAIGALLFATGNQSLGGFGRFLQGAGGAFSSVGAIYIATTQFPPSAAATLIGATQMFGMAGGTAGQFVVGPMMKRGLPWVTFWVAMGLIGFAIAAVLWFLIPSQKKAENPNWLGEAFSALGVVFRNPQSILCGIIAGLLFIPTTILDMVWGVRYLQEAHGMDYTTAVMRSAAVPFGWIIGCPLLGFITDKLGRRKPVIFWSGAVLLAALAWALFGSPGILPPYIVGLTMGIASGSAMIPTTVIKESNPAKVGGTATGVINFINFTFSALLGPVFARLLARAAAGAASPELAHYQSAFSPMLAGVVLAMVLTLMLKETGPGAAKQPAVDFAEAKA